MKKILTSHRMKSPDVKWMQLAQLAMPVVQAGLANKADLVSLDLQGDLAHLESLETLDHLDHSLISSPS